MNKLRSFILILLLLVFSVPTPAQHTFGNNSTLQSHATDPSTWSFTPDAGSTVLCLFIVGVSATARAGGAPTFNGVTMTQADSIRNPPIPEVTTEFWYLLSPPIVTANFSIPNTAAITIRSYAATGKAATGFTSALDVANGAAGNSTDPTASVTTTANGTIIFSVVGSSHNSFGTSTGQDGTLLQNFDGGVYGGGFQYLLQATAGAQPMGWLITTSQWSLAVAAFKEVASGAVPRRPVIIMQ